MRRLRFPPHCYRAWLKHKFNIAWYKSTSLNYNTHNISPCSIALGACVLTFRLYRPASGNTFDVLDDRCTAIVMTGK
jgi:hypothetical protein